MSEYLCLKEVTMVYYWEFLASVPNAYKAFLECLLNKVCISNAEFANRIIWCGDFPLLTRDDYIGLLKKKGIEYIFKIDLVQNEDDGNLFGDNDYIKYLEGQEQEEEIKIKIKDDEGKKEEEKEGNILIK